MDPNQFFVPPQPGPAPVAPTPAPAPAPRPPRAGLSAYLTPLSVFALAGVLLYSHMYPNAAPGPADRTVNGVALGKSYTPTLAGTYATAWEAAAKTLEDGKTVADAQKSLQESWQAERIAAFKKDVEPGFSLVLPAGTEPTDPAKRAAVVSLWRDFAKGLRGGK